jgi:DNA helicase-2/ATP-dependent DNA helicase PcrA
MSIWFKSLNPEQIEAVAHTNGPLLILAGAGSGKTTVLVSRTGRLIGEKVSIPERICVLTFTNKSAQELKHRVAAKLGDTAAQVWAGTFHGFGLRFLREHWKAAGLPDRFGVIDQSDSQSILKDLVRDHTVYDKARLNLDILAAKISQIREHGKGSVLDKIPEAAAAEILAPKYMTRMRGLGVVDFEELLLRPLKMIREDSALLKKTQDRFDYLMVDEFQDTNAVQMRLLDEMAREHGNLAVVGDDDQSIYGWRGAEIQNILNFPKRFKDCKVVRLERNYRSSSAILNLANAVIANNKTRHGKVLKASAAIEGDKPELFVFENEEAEIEQITKELQEFQRKGYKWREMALLYRSNSQGGLMEGGLRRAQIPYKLSGGTALFDRKEARDVMAFIRCALHPNELSFRRILNVPARGVGEKTIEAIEAATGAGFVAKARAWTKANPEVPAGQGIQKLFEFLEQLKQKLVGDVRSAEEVLNAELREFGYRAYVNQSYQELTAADARWLSVLIIGRILDGMFGKHGRSLKTLQMFMDCMELRDAPDDEEGKKDQVQLMTLHACKGLEFPLVILLGVEEELLPHGRLGHSVDEERRLFYVGVTRARRHLVLSRVEQRKRYGKPQPVAPSRFLLEIKAELYNEMRGGRPLALGAREAMLAGLREKLDKRMKDFEQDV